ncbi:hypothetical protein AOQ84DRAFT_301185 [Glonium stellatum]|uniref:F-box domain-containing protein n=1 Tax=Glonium stellatum TaxID=574774 RepID=A0A8E2ESY8_9PEZI|nr:hypothetical protein AOQ84DRAFT_301185 [Glonium stellatum]
MTSLDELPYDVLYCIASSLSFDDVVRLSLTCRQLRLLLNETTLCRRTIETHVPHSHEAKLARREEITYREAVQRIYERRSAFAKAAPLSARILGHGSAFLYRQGVLCFLTGNYIRVLDLHTSSGPPRAIDIISIIKNEVPPGIPNVESKVSLLYYSDDIVAVHYERKSRPSDSWIFAISTKADIPTDLRVVAREQLESSSRLFVRHTASYLYFGTHSGTGTHGHHEWRIHRMSLGHEHAIPAEGLQLEDFVGSDIGSTVAFEIHEGYFYALSNQTSFDVEEVDWTSFYHCIRFPLERPFKNALEINARIYRRQHAEGPINDSWTDLSLQVDESTNDLVIVESRREWLEGGSTQHRTFYTQHISFPDSQSSSSSPDSSPIAAPSTGPALPSDDPYVALLTSGDNPHWAPSQPRYLRYTHPEYGLKADPARPFILARTKLRAYNLSCSSFIDLVEDDKCCGAYASSNNGPCLRLRIGSRRLAPLHDDFSLDGASGKAKVMQESSLRPLSGLDDRFRYSPIKMWPPSERCPCAKRLHQILNPPTVAKLGSNRTLVGAVDERSVVYMIRPARLSSGDEDCIGPIVLVSFDREIGRQTLVTSDDMADAVMSDDGATAQGELRLKWEAGKAEACKDHRCR